MKNFQENSRFRLPHPPGTLPQSITNPHRSYLTQITTLYRTDGRPNLNPCQMLRVARAFEETTAVVVTTGLILLDSSSITGKTIPSAFQC